jgi:hypothetical protein
MPNYRNLLNETIQIINGVLKSVEDVEWVGTINRSENFYCSWDDFSKAAANINYNAGFGGAEICSDLVVCGKDWWLERHEYDGSEWWEFKELPARPEVYNAQKIVDVLSQWDEVD